MALGILCHYSNFCLCKQFLKSLNFKPGFCFIGRNENLPQIAKKLNQHGKTLMQCHTWVNSPTALITGVF